MILKTRERKEGKKDTSNGLDIITSRVFPFNLNKEGRNGSLQM